MGYTLSLVFLTGPARQTVPVFVKSTGLKFRSAETYYQDCYALSIALRSVAHCIPAGHSWRRGAHVSLSLGILNYHSLHPV